MGDIVLEVVDLKTYYYTSEGVVKAVDGVSFTVERGKCVAIVGESGSGKSTIAASILGLVTPPGKVVGGKIMLEGENLLNKTAEEMRRLRGAEIAIVFQDPMSSLNPLFTAGFQVAEVLIEHRAMTLREAAGRVVELFQHVQIPDPHRVYSSYPHELSGGMRQRVMIAMSLACRPKLLIADEPTSALDVTIQAQILDLLRDIKEKLGTAILFITHDLGLVPQIADEVVVMYAGKIVEKGPVKEVFTKPHHPYTEALLGCYPRIRKGSLATIRGGVPSLINPPTGCRFHPRCDRAFARCPAEEPEFIEVTANHWTACHLYTNAEEKRNGAGSANSS
jgi:oligopeptide/dipeptide ABC transporter ATP-binding protein